MAFTKNDDVNRCILKLLPIEDILSLLLVNKDFKNNIRNNDKFWSEKYLETFGEERYKIKKSENKNWMMSYISGKKKVLYEIDISVGYDVYDGADFVTVTFFEERDKFCKVGDVTSHAIGKFKHERKLSKFGSYTIHLKDEEKTKVSSKRKVTSTSYIVYPFDVICTRVSSSYYTYFP